jgi:hypothetical protein
MTADSSPLITTPVAILIFDNDGHISYKAYSPINYNFIEDDNDIQNSQFLADLYSHIAYNDFQPLINTTNYGKLKEIHIRYIQIPNNRPNTCYFTTNITPHCYYKSIHRDSPIFFDVIQAQIYANTQPTLYHCECSYEFI